MLTCRLLNFERGGNGNNELIVVDQEGLPVQCKLPSDSLSKPVKLPVIERKLIFRREIAEPPVAIATVPSGITEALLVFLPSDDPKFDYRPVVLDGSKKGFPESGCLVLNIYSEEVRFILGEHKIMLPPGKTAKLERPEQRDNFNMAGVVFQFKTDKGWRAAYETMSRFPEGQRHLYIAYVDPKSKRPKVRSYRD